MIMMLIFSPIISINHGTAGAYIGDVGCFDIFLYTALIILVYVLLCCVAGVYTKFSGRLSEEPFPWLIQKFPCILIFKTGQAGCQLNLSVGQIRLDLTSGRPLM